MNKPKDTNDSKKKGKSIAAILVRGTIGTRQDIRQTIKQLHLGRKHTCAILDDTESVRGMCKKSSNYVAWGEVSEETISALSKARGQHKVYHLNPPRKGFGKKGIKAGFGAGGALGYWGQKINDLIMRML